MAKSKAKSKPAYEAPTMEIHNANPAAATQESVALGDLFKQLGGYAKAHPWITAGTGLNAAGNVAGLMDNDKLLGQAAGTALGAFAPKLLGLALGKNIAASPLMIANLAMGGGNIGALFDNLRAKQEQEQAMAQQYGGSY